MSLIGFIAHHSPLPIPPDNLPSWPNHTPGRLTEVERYIATAPQPPTVAEIGAAFADTVAHELEDTLRLLLSLERITLVEDRYHWQG